MRRSDEIIENRPPPLTNSEKMGTIAMNMKMISVFNFEAATEEERA
jgi:hypothetical protein